MFSNYLKKSLAFVLTLMLVLSVAPVQVLAAENGDDSASQSVQTEVLKEQIVLSAAEPRALSDSKIEVTSKRTSNGGSFNHNTNGTNITVVADSGLLNRAKGTVTITNKKDCAVVLTFVYTVSGSKATLSGAISGNSGLYNAVLNKGASVSFDFDSGAINTDATLYIEGVSAKEIVAGPANINFIYNPAYGSVNGSGTAGQKVTVTAAASAGSKFLAWTDENNIVLSVSPSYSFIASGNDTLKALFANPEGEAYFAADGNIAVGRYLHSDLNKAAATGNKIVLVADGTLAAGNYTIPSGVTLLIPKDAAYTVNTNKPTEYAKDDKNGKLPHITPSAFRTLKMAEGANITVKGALNVAGSQYAGGTGDIMGGVYGPVGFIKMAAGSKITVNGGAFLYVWGYIMGSGEVEILKNGTVYESFQSTDWRGGSATSALALDDKNNVFPMTQYYVQNVEVPMKLYAGAIEKGYSCTTVSPVQLVGVKGAEVPFIGSGESNLFTIDSGYIIKDYDEATDRQVYKVYGNLSMKKIRVSMDAGLLGTTITLDSSKYVLPITNNLSIEVHSGTINMTQDCCFLPGSEIIVHQGATCNLTNGKSVYVYDSAEWGGYVGSLNAKFIPLGYAPGRTFNRTQLSDAKIQIDGTINASAGFLYTTKSGAVVTSTGTGRVIMKSGTATETYQISQTGTDTSNVAIPVVVAKLQNADGTTTDPAKEINPAAGTIYTYTDGKWVAKCRNSKCEANGQLSCSNPLPCKFCGQTVQPAHKYVGAVTTPAECTEDGEKTFTCSVCGDFYTEKIDATGHTEATDAAVAPECEETGLTEGKHCSVCNEVLVPQEEVPATGHTFTEVIAENTATCIATGNHAYKSCSVCNKYFAADAAADSTDGKADNSTFIIPVDNTNHVNKTSHLQTDSNCTDEGFTAGEFCEDCDTWVSGHQKIEALGHKSVTDNAVPATCTEKGKTEGSHCSVCNAVLVPQTEVEALGHKPVTDNAVPATCTEKGKTEGSHCSVCNTVLVPQTEVPATGHKLTWTETKPATAFEEGESTGKCQTCGYTEKKAVAKLLKIDVKPEAKEIKLASNGVVVAFEQISASTMLENITEKSEIVTIDGKKVAADAVIATGMKIVLKDSTGKIADEKIIIVPGDVDCDGSVSSSDARIALRVVVGLDEIKDYQENAADVDRDSKITASDAREILRASVGLTDKKDFFDKIK